jgi:hypothetical protein
VGLAVVGAAGLHRGGGHPRRVEQAAVADAAVVEEDGARAWAPIRIELDVYDKPHREVPELAFERFERGATALARLCAYGALEVAIMRAVLSRYAALRGKDKPDAPLSIPNDLATASASAYASASASASSGSSGSGLRARMAARCPHVAKALRFLTAQHFLRRSLEEQAHIFTPGPFARAFKLKLDSVSASLAEAEASELARVDDLFHFYYTVP